MRVQPRALAATLSAVLLAGCTVGPDFSAPKLKLPPQFTERPATPTEIALADAQVARWWQSFNDPTLDQLVRQAVAGNIDLKMARQRLVEARAERVEVAAGGLPSVDFGGQYVRARSSTNVTWPPGTGNYQYYQYGFDASWELDIFGGNRRATQAADFGVKASIEDRRAILVSLLAEVATDYATLRARQAELAIAESNVKIARDTLSYATQLESQGIGTTVAVLQARAQLERTQSSLPRLHADIAVMAHAIAVLLGHNPGYLEAMLEAPRPPMLPPPSLPDTVPSDVIANRPDVHEALMQYGAANAEIGVAVAAELPHFTIPLTLTPQASLLGELFQAASVTFSAAIEGTQHLYEGGKLRAGVEKARAAAEDARLAYRQTVLSALQQVEDALVREQTERAANASLRASVRDAEKALSESTRLYNAGLTDFLTVLTDERTVFQSRDALAQSDLTLLLDDISLYKALGGGWQQIDLDPPTTVQK